MQPTQGNDITANEVTLCVAFELSRASWKLAFHDGKRDTPAIVTVRAETPQARLDEARAAIEAIGRKWGLCMDTPVAMVYEAGQDGFWIGRALCKQGMDVKVIDPASLPVQRHARRAKTDRLDAIRLVNSLRAWLRGERDVMHVVRVPDEQAEAQRHLVRERGELQKEITQHQDRMRKLLRTVGCWDAIGTDFALRLAQGQVRCHNGRALPAELAQRLQRECERLALAQQQLQALEETLVQQLPAPAQQKIAQLSRLKGVGQVGAMRLVLELFWRRFDNRRQVGACVGLVPQPYDSGESRVDQGISKQGNRRVRSLLIEMAWMWLRYQPKSALAAWFAQRTQGQNKRGKRVAIVAVARRLVIDLWKYLEHGLVPQGAAMKG
jgi:transposase